MWVKRSFISNSEYFYENQISQILKNKLSSTENMFSSRMLSFQYSFQFSNFSTYEQSHFTGHREEIILPENHKSIMEIHHCSSHCISWILCIFLYSESRHNKDCWWKTHTAQRTQVWEKVKRRSDWTAQGRNIFTWSKNHPSEVFCIFWGVSKGHMGIRVQRRIWAAKTRDSASSMKWTWRSGCSRLSIRIAHKLFPKWKQLEWNPYS